MDKIQTVEMVRCEVTGKIVPALECEYVVIKILKHRDADINDVFSPVVPGRHESYSDANIFAPRATAQTKVPEVKVPEGAVLLTQDELVRDRPKIVPPKHMQAFMTPNDTPGESIFKI